MKSLASWLLVFFLVIFWVFRIIVTLSAQYGGDFGGFIVFDTTIEIVLLFVSLLCFILILRRMLLGGIIYLLGYGFYFGRYIFTSVVPALMEGETLDFVVLQNTVVAVIGIVLGVCVVLDILVERSKRKNYSDNKTDWFFKNKNYDRELDERADKNQYRTL